MGPLAPLAPSRRRRAARVCSIRCSRAPTSSRRRRCCTGCWSARGTGARRLVARLGREANDPIDELLNAALAYSAAHTPSLQGFIQWFDAGEGELKREPGAGKGLVRVMTVHGSKGLQAPIVILADAAGDPDRSPTRGLTLDEQLPGGGGRTIPLPGLSRAEKVGRVAEAEAAAAKAEKQEHWRLLYVAMTRAEEALFVGGALGKTEKDGPAADSWYARLAPLFPGAPLDDPIWGHRLEWGERAAPVADTVAAEEPAVPALPGWALRPIGPEPRPPRPLAPSSAGEEQGADPPAAARGPGCSRPGAACWCTSCSSACRISRPTSARRRRGPGWRATRPILPRPTATNCSRARWRCSPSRTGRSCSVPRRWPRCRSPRPSAAQVIAGTADRLLVEPGPRARG